MNAKQTKEAKRAVTMLAFAEDRVTDFTHTPPKPVDTKHAATITKLQGAINDLGGKQAIQESDEFGEATGEQQGDRGDVEAMLRKINATMASVAEDQKQPALMDRFRMPHGNGDSELAAKLTGFADAIDELELLDELEAHNLIVTTDALREMATNLKSGAGAQGLALAKQSGATAAIPEALKTARECKKTFDAIYNNTYDGNTEMLAAWRSASHVERTNPKAKEAATAGAPK
jgi:hypothetical protein